MKYYQLAPSILIVMQLISAAGYFAAGDTRRVVYWIAGAAITWAVTF